MNENVSKKWLGKLNARAGLVACRSRATRRRRGHALRERAERKVGPESGAPIAGEQRENSDEFGRVLRPGRVAGCPGD